MDRLAALGRHLCARSAATPAPTGQPDPSPSSSRVWRGGSPAPSPAHLGRWPEAEKDPEWPWEMATRFDLSPSPHAAALIVIDMQAGDMVIESPATPSQQHAHPGGDTSDRADAAILPRPRDAGAPHAEREHHSPRAGER